MKALFKSVKRFFAEAFSPYVTYSAYIFKFWVNQITISALGILVSFAIYLTEGIPLLQFVLALFPVGFICFLIYDFMYAFGLKDSVSIEYEKMEFDKPFGLRIFAFAYAPSLLLILLTVFFTLGNVSNAPVITTVIYYLFNAYNLGIFWITAKAVPTVVMMFVMMLPLMISCFLGYYLGAKNTPLRSLLGIPIKEKKPKKPDQTAEKPWNEFNRKNKD